MKKIKIKPLLIPLIFVIIFSCKKTNNEKEIASNPLFNEENFKYEVKFPDTIFLNEKNDGEIIYESPFDSITNNFSDSEKKRYVVYRTLKNNSHNFLNEFYNDSLKEYRIGAIDNRTIPFYDLQFYRTGEFNIEGIINDQILIEPNTKYNSDKNGFRLIEKDFPIVFKVVVIDSIEKNEYQ